MNCDKDCSSMVNPNILLFPKQSSVILGFECWVWEDLYDHILVLSPVILDWRGRGSTCSMLKHSQQLWAPYISALGTHFSQSVVSLPNEVSATYMEVSHWRYGMQFVGGGVPIDDRHSMGIFHLEITSKPSNYPYRHCHIATQASPHSTLLFLG